MSHQIDLKKYDIHTDIIVETYDKAITNKGIEHKEYSINNILVEETIINEEGEKTCNKKKGIYRTISFNDITDKTNFKSVEEVFVQVFKEFLKVKGIKESDSCLIIGLGNEKSTPDSLGPLSIDKILVTKHLYSLGEVEKGYRNVSVFKPSVTGLTGIETKELIRGILGVCEPDFIIVIDALSSSSISRLNKTIQISDSGIMPGSGIGNNRKELTEEVLNIPVIAIGVPTVVDSSTIVFDTIKYMIKKISYMKENENNKKLKFVPDKKQNYLDNEKELSTIEKQELLGIIGNLDNQDLKEFIDEVLSPIDYNLMVTVKEVDYIIEKLALLISNGINKSLHENFNKTF